MAAAEEEAAAEICEDCPKVGAASDRMMVSFSSVSFSSVSFSFVSSKFSKELLLVCGRYQDRQMKKNLQK